MIQVGEVHVVTDAIAAVMPKEFGDGLRIMLVSGEDLDVTPNKAPVVTPSEVRAIIGDELDMIALAGGYVNVDAIATVMSGASWQGQSTRIMLVSGDTLNVPADSNHVLKLMQESGE